MTAFPPLSIANELSDAPSISAYLDNLRSSHAKPSAEHRFDRVKIGYEHPDLGDDPRPDDKGKADVALARAIGERLNFFYPGHPWHIEVMSVQGVALIRIPPLMGWVASYVIHLDKLASDPRMDIVRKAGGEILERYRISRNRYSYWEFADACQKVTMRDHRKGIVPE
jgi:hypothetical protein